MLQSFKACSRHDKHCVRTYSQALQFLSKLNGILKKDGILAPNSTSLANTQFLYGLIDKPLDRIPVVHVGGTNGKGTTCFKLAQYLIASGKKTGLFVSPHISSYRERIQVNNRLIPEDRVTKLLSDALALCTEHTIAATSFELGYIIACMHFAAEQVDVAVVEVGSGGEWDATNVMCPLLSIIASVGLDHMGFLGNTIEEIAIVKAGIFKPQRLALIGADTPQHLLQQQAEKRGATPFRIQDIIASHKALFETLYAVYEAEGKFSTVDFDVANAELAAAAVILLHTHHTWPPLSSSLLHSLVLRPPCRWEVRNTMLRPDVSVVLDVAHNAPAITALLQRATRIFPNRHLSIVYGASRDKDIHQCVRCISQHVSSPQQLYFIQSSNYRAVSPALLASLYNEVTGQTIPECNYSCDDASKIIDVLVSRAIVSAPSDGVIMIFGSMYFMPNVRATLGIDEPCDTVQNTP